MTPVRCFCHRRADSQAMSGSVYNAAKFSAAVSDPCVTEAMPPTPQALVADRWTMDNAKLTGAFDRDIAVVCRVDLFFFIDTAGVLDLHQCVVRAAARSYAAVSTAYGPAWTNPNDRTVGGVQAAAKPKPKTSKRPRAPSAVVTGSPFNDTAPNPTLAFDKRAVLNAFALLS